MAIALGPDPFFWDGLLSIQRQDTASTAFLLVYQGIRAKVVYPKDTQLTEFGERDRIRILIGTGRIVLPNDRALLTARKDGRGALVPLTSPEVYTVQDYLEKASLRALGQLLCYKLVQ